MKIDPKQIPGEVVEAGKDAAFGWLRSFMEDDVRVKSMTDDELGELVCATLDAALAAWPDGGVVSEQYSKHNPRIILPLPKEGE
jgi:hypothetical protein